MKVMRIHMERQQWGPNEGKLTGEVTFSDRGGEVKLMLDDAGCDRICKAMAQGVVDVAKNVADNLSASVFESVNSALPPPAQA